MDFANFGQTKASCFPFISIFKAKINQLNQLWASFHLLIWYIGIFTKMQNKSVQADTDWNKLDINFGQGTFKMFG